MTTSNKGPYSRVDRIAGDLYAVYAGLGDSERFVAQFTDKASADECSDALNSAHHAALASVAGEVRELVEAADNMTTAWANKSALSWQPDNNWHLIHQLRLALSAPAISALLQEKQ